MVIGRIILYEHLDSEKLETLLADGVPLQLEIERRYTLANVPDAITANLPEQFEGTAVDYMQALGRVFDVSGYIHEQGSVVFNIQYAADTKVFDLSGSYIRDAVSPGECSAVASGTELIAVFTTPGLENPATTVIVLEYGEDISGPSLAALASVGIMVNLGGTGSVFSIKSQTGPYKVQFFQPETAVVNYAIDFNMNNKTIEI